MLAFTTDDLANIFRSDVDDPLEGSTSAPDSDNLWKNTDVYTYMTEAADSVARDVEGIYKIFQIALIAGQQSYTLPRNVLHIREARLVGARRRLDPINAEDTIYTHCDDYGERVSGGGWFTTSGNPRRYMRDYQKNALMIGGIPTETDSLEIQCTATIAVPLTAGLPLPFMDVPDQRLMLLYMKHLAYAKQDADTLDLKRSDEFKAQYDERALGRKTSLESYRRAPGLIHQWD